MKSTKQPFFCRAGYRLVNCDKPTAQEMAARIRSQVRMDKFHIPGHCVQMTISIWTAVFSWNPDSDIRDTFKHADIALYRAKKTVVIRSLIIDTQQMK